MGAMTGHSEDDERELTPEEVAALRSNAVGRGLLRLRERGAEQFWRERRRQSLAFRFLGGFAVYLILVRSIRVPLIRQIMGLTLGAISTGIWQAIYGFAVILLLGLRRNRGDANRR